MKEYFSFVKQYKKEIESKNPFLYMLPAIIGAICSTVGTLIYEILFLLKNYSFAHTVLEIGTLIVMILLSSYFIILPVKATIKYMHLNKGQQ